MTATDPGAPHPGAATLQAMVDLTERLTGLIEG